MSVKGSLVEALKKLRGALSPDFNLWSYVTLTSLEVYKESLRGEESPGLKRQLIEEVCSKFRGEALRGLLQPVNRHLETVGEALALSGYQVKECTVEASARVVIGTGEPFGKVPFEVGMSFDPVLNVPYIPGTALKGAFRHALAELIERHLAGQGRSGSQARSSAERVAESYFGSREGAGLVGVTDAYPVGTGANGMLFEPDVVTPHYPGARDELGARPKPVPFLAVARGVRFRFFIYFNREIRASARGGRVGVVRSLGGGLAGDPMGYAVLYGDLAELVRGGASSQGSGQLAQALPWLDRAVLYAFARGVGAKTNVGYSRFEVVGYRPFRV